MVIENKRIRSFVLRAGRVTAAQERAILEQSPHFGIALDSNSGNLSFNLREVFGRIAPLCLEIGFGNGENILQLALKNPDRDYIGVEVHRAGVGHLLNCIAQAGLTNIKVIFHDAVEVLENYILPGSFDEILILFPDPWQKKRHNKRRLVQKKFIALLASRLKPKGLLNLATDWESYATQMLEVLSAQPELKNRAANNRFISRPEWRVLSRFERRSQRLGHSVWDLSFERL